MPLAEPRSYHSTSRSPHVVHDPPLNATRTPMFAPVIGTLIGAALLSQIESPPAAAEFVSGVEASTAPVTSLMNQARALVGLTSGTPTGSAPAAVLSA